jgi:sigma-B regulation protein RsbU (phosphoserine phosphatase)
LGNQPAVLPSMLKNEHILDFLETADRDGLVQEIKKYIALLQENENLLSHLDLDKILEKVLGKACFFTGAANASIFLVNREENILEFAASTDSSVQGRNITVPLGSGIAGKVAQEGKPVNITDAQNDPNFYQKVDEKTGQTTKSYLCVPLIAEERIIGTAQLLNKDPCFDQDDERFMMLFAGQAALAIETAILHRQSMEKQAMEQDVRHAIGIQQNLLPKNDLEIPGYLFRGSSDAARMVGGDYYNYFQPFGENGPVYAVLADVSGKGVPAALIVSNLHAALQLILPYHTDLSRCTMELNNFLCENLTFGTFITFFMMKFNPGEADVEYVSCGHNPTFQMPPASAPNANRIRKLGNSGPILGLRKSMPYESMHTRFEPGDMLVIYSDGVVEAQNSEMDMYGEERFLKTIRKVQRKMKQGNEEALLTSIHWKVLEDIDKFRAGHKVNDDTTLLLAYRCLPEE